MKHSIWMQGPYKILATLIIFASTPPADAYIPRVKTIMNKVSRNNGRHTYKIVREITFENENNFLRAKEVWWVRNGDNMKLEVSSLDQNNPWKFEIAYSPRKRRTISSSRTVKEYKKSREFFEPLFHDRSSKSLLSRLVKHQFVPPWAQSIPAPDYDEGQTKMTNEPFVRLEPQNGSVNFVVGAQTTVEGGPNPTTLWIEQDSFVIKKGRLSSSAEFTNDEFQTFPGGLKLPRKQTITWNNRVARVQLVSAAPVKVKNSLLSLNSTAPQQIPNEQIIKEFYSRFR